MNCNTDQQNAVFNGIGSHPFRIPSEDPDLVLGIVLREIPLGSKPFQFFEVPQASGDGGGGGSHLTSLGFVPLKLNEKVDTL